MIVGLMADLGHGLDHVMTEPQGPEAEASGGVIHTHGGAPHAHEGPVEALILGSEQVEEEQTEPAPIPTWLAGHIPSGAPVLKASAPAEVPPGASRAEARLNHGRRPLLPPPRAQSSFRI